MSDKKNPTLADILEAIERQGTRLAAVDQPKQAERSMTEAPCASDLHSSLAQTVTLIEMQVRRLRGDVDELRGRK